MILKVVKMSIKVMSVDPVDIGVERHLSDFVVGKVFEDYFSERNQNILQSIKDVNPVYVRAKELLMQLANEKKLTQSKYFHFTFYDDELEGRSSNNNDWFRVCLAIDCQLFHSDMYQCVCCFRSDPSSQGFDRGDED